MKGRRSASSRTLSRFDERVTARRTEPDADSVDVGPTSAETLEIDTLESDIASPTDATHVSDAIAQPMADAEPVIEAEPVVLASRADRDAGASDPVTLIEIGPEVSGSFAHNRFNVVIRGRAISPSSLEEILVRADDRTLATASYGQPERAAVAAMPDGTPGRQRGFQFNLPRQNDGQPELFTFQVIARNTDGFEYAETFVVELDPTASGPLEVVTGPTRSTQAGGARPHALIYIERGTIDGEGNLAVQGWAVALGPILAVQIFVDEQRVSAARLGGEREDVAAAHLAYPNARLSGFNLTIQLEEEDRQATTIRAQVICSNGFAQEEAIPVERVHRRAAPRRALPRGAMPIASDDAAAYPVPPAGFSLFNQRPAYQLTADFRIDEMPVMSTGLLAPLPDAAVSALASPGPARAEASSEIRMFCDEAELHTDGSLHVSGWAVCAAGIAQVRVLLDEKEIGLAAFGYERSDVGAIFANIPMARLSGFRFERRLGQRFEGKHVVRVVVSNARAGKSEESLPLSAKLVAGGPTALAPAVAGTPVAPVASAEPTAEHDAEFRFELDSPALANGSAIELVTGRLTIEGWLLSRSGIASFEVFLDDQRLGDAHCGLARQDVGAAFPEWPNALRSGYAFHCPPRSLRDGDHTVTLRLRANSGHEMVRQFQITVKKSEDQQDHASIRRRISRVETDLMADLLTDLSYHPTYRFIWRVGGSVDAEQVTITLDTLRLLAFADWSVLVLSEDDEVASLMRNTVLETVPHLADRFAVVSASDTQRWNAPVGDRPNADATLYALLQAGDELGADMLLELAVAGGMHRDADMLYSDEIRPSPVTGEMEPFLKPDFSPDLLYSTNYLGRAWVVTAALLARTGMTPADLQVHGEYDLVLRCVEQAALVHHVRKILHRRSASKVDDPVREQAALQRMLARRGEVGEVLASPIPGTWRMKRTVMANGRVSIIIPTCGAHGYIKTCIESLRARTAYSNYEIICIDNIPAGESVLKAWLGENADKIVDIPDAFNWSTFNNRAAEVADGEFLLFLNDDMEVAQEDWLDAMVEHGQRPEVGITGARLLYPDGKVQHAGMFLSNNGLGRHAFRFSASNDPGYFGLALTQRNVIAVTGACLLVRRETFEKLGRFDEAHQIVNNDLDFCLRGHRAGLLTVFTPYATLIHHELASRARMRDVFDLTHFDAAWKSLFAAGDPYFNPRLSRHADDYRPDDEPVQWVTPGSPLFHTEEIERILVVKLDHIGDFVTALQPIRRLKEIFPKATITVLAGHASRAFASLEAAISEFIAFDFFHARSQLGERELESDDFIALEKQLRPYRFDLAVDLRKHTSTRDVLKYTGARFLAGFDYLGQFPFLDVSLDWDGDRTLQRKRSHIIDDLLGLVNAIGHATKTDRAVMQPRPTRMPLSDLPEEVQTLFARPVVAVHPGAGNTTKQWPTEHFSALIDLLIERNGVNVLLIGGPDEVAVANDLLQSVVHREAIASMAGKTSLVVLPRLLLNCALYIGNDSGPKHIAAAIGLPTIGVHSGVVDPVEWGPLGPRAIALRRNMTCSPCYLARAEDCPRSLACLRLLEPNLVYEAAVMLLKPPEPATEAEATESASTPERDDIAASRQPSSRQPGRGRRAAAKSGRQPVPATL
jgi:ADP-heptose:LPS heptosyltransferase/GT2 family glycosyltransferase